MKIGIFGGTFNPPHKTHLNMAIQAGKQLCLDKLFVVPCGDPPHKKTDMDKYTRLKLTQIAFAGIGEVCDYELTKQGKSYTVDTLRYIRELYPTAQLFLIIGGDSLRDFSQWYHPEEILQLCTLAVCNREGVSVPSHALSQDKIVFVQFEPNDVSSTEIRLRYVFQKDNCNFVTQEVDSFVKTHNLYQQNSWAIAKLQSMLTPKRFDHTYHVVKRGLELAPSSLKDKVFWACLLHDCAKYIDKNRHSEYGFDAKDMPEPIVHAFLGELVAQKDFGITDGEILSAIKYHCTAKPNMSELEMIVYVADKTEETRPYPLEHLLKGTLLDMFVACLLEANLYCQNAHGEDMYYLTQQAIDYYNGI